MLIKEILQTARTCAEIYEKLPYFFGVMCFL